MTVNKRLFLPLLLLGALSACDYMPSWMGGKTVEIERLPGERMTVLPVATELQADEAAKNIPVNLPPVNDNAEWPEHTGVFTSASSNLGGKGNFDNDSSATAGDGEAFEHTLIPRPVVAAGNVFAMDAEGKISAHEMGNIDHVLWISDGVSEKKIDDVNGGGLAYAQGRLYAVSGRGVVVAIDTTNGNLLWRKTGHSPLRSAPKVAGGKLFVITIDSQLLVFDAASGEVVWDHRGIDETAGLMNSVSPTVSGDTVVVPYESGELYALSVNDGHEMWNNSLALAKRTQASSIFAGIGGDPVVDGDVVFAVSNGGLLAVYGMLQGQRLWERPIASINTPWVAGDYLYLLTAENTLAAFVKYDGRVRWATQVPSFEDMELKRRPIFWRGPVMVDGKLVLVSSRGEMKFYSAENGSELSTVSIPDDVYTAPVVAGGKIYLITKSAKLYSLQ